MKRTSKIIISSLVLFAIAIWSGGCATNSATSDSTGDTSNELSTFGLPATIAKLEVDTIDSTTPYLSVVGETATGADGNISASESSDSETIGTLYWQHKNLECRTSALIASNTVIGITESDPDNDCTSAIELGSEYTDIDLAIVNLSPGAALNDDGEISGNASLPIGIVIHSPIPGVTDTYTLTVTNTFMDRAGNLSAGILKDVFEKETGFLVDANGNESIAFVTEDDTDNINLSTVDIKGGDIVDLVTLTDSPLAIQNTISETDNDILYLYDEGFNVFRIGMDGTTDELLILDLLKQNNTKIAPAPTGDYLLYTADAGGGFKGLGIFDVRNDIDLGIIKFNGPKYNYLSLAADWADSSSIIFTSIDQDGVKRLQTARVANFIESGVTPVLQTVQTFDTDSAIFRPVSDNGVNGYTFFVCATSETDYINALCRYDSNDASVTVVAEYDYDVVHLVISKDRSSYVAFEIASSPHFICIHSIGDEENSCIGPGRNVVTSNNKNNIVSFQSTIAGTPQVAIFNTDHNFTLTPSPLEIAPLLRNVAAESSFTFSASGGVPPYSYTVTSGSGTVTSLGLYTAPTSSKVEQVEQVTVTDSGNNSAVATITIPAGGSLNTVFGTNGIKNINVGSKDSGWDVIFEGGGKIILAGSISNGSNTDLAIIKLTGQAGNLDTSFGGGDGVVVIDVSGGDDNTAAIMQQSDGKIVVVGDAVVSGTQRAVIARLTNNGDLDPTFGTSGVTISTLGNGASRFRDVEVLGNGTILVCGRVFFNSTGDDFLLARFTSTGTLDATFSSDGFVAKDFGMQLDTANTMAVQQDGSIVIAGKGRIGTLDQFALARYTINGDADTSFGTNGGVLTVVGSQFNQINEIMIEDNGNIVAAGIGQNIGSTQDFAIARYKSNGSLDSGFTSDGFERYDTPALANSAAYSLVKSNDKYLMGGYSSLNDSNFYLLRINTDGGVDTSFGNNGVVTTNITGHDEIHALHIPAGNNNIIAVGTTTSGTVSQMSVVVYWP